MSTEMILFHIIYEYETILLIELDVLM